MIKTPRDTRINGTRVEHEIGIQKLTSIAEGKRSVGRTCLRRDDNIKIYRR
jgi:hypothetical protein